MRILAIESSCDETSASVVEKINGTTIVLSNITATSLSLHAATGGIIPENAARMQVKYIMPVITEALNISEGCDNKNDINFTRKILREKIDAIAVTYGPGLIGSLLVGVETAKTLAFTSNKPLISVNHLLAHIFANYINRKEDEIKFPFIGLIVSGGHTDLLIFKNSNDFQWLGGTRDDAAGEALDKIGRLLNLPYPAGPEIESRAKKIERGTIRFHSPLINEDNFDFSFSGLKTEVMRFIQNSQITESLTDEICHATQEAIIKVLIKKTLTAAEKFNSKMILIGGGVSANGALREQLRKDAEKMDITVLFPEKEYSTDNGAMIGAFALQNQYAVGWHDVKANPELYFSHT